MNQEFMIAFATPETYRAAAGTHNFSDQRVDLEKALRAYW